MENLTEATGIDSDEDTGPAPVVAARRRRAASSKTLPKIGMEHTVKSATAADKMKRLQEGYYSRQRILVVPPEILAAHPDKHFAFLNMNKLEKNGFWNANGYECLKVNEKEGDPSLARFSKSVDGFVHRNEMVLAYISKEEYETQQLEKELMMRNQTVGDVISKNPDLYGFDAYAQETREVRTA